MENSKTDYVIIEDTLNQPLLDNEEYSQNENIDELDFVLADVVTLDKIIGPSIEDNSLISKLYENDSDDDIATATHNNIILPNNNNPYRGIRYSLKMELLARKPPLMLSPHISKAAPSPNLNHLIDMGVIVNPNNKDDHSNNSHSLYKGDVTIDEWNKLSQYESLDYQTCHNSLHKRDISKLTQQDYTNDSIQRWLIACFIGVITGIIAFAVHYIADIIQEKKFNQTFEYIKDHGFTYAWTYLILLNLFLISFGTLSIIYIAPAANSSGIPFVKAYLNGARIPKAFNIKTLVAKFIGVISCVSTSIPVGPEGPMIHIGGMIGGGVSQSQSKTLGCELPILRRFRNDHERRDFISLGAACGVAAAFGSPAGGLLFAMEEASSFWSSVMTWRTFLACIMATFITNLLSNGVSGSSSWGSLNLDELILFNIKNESSYQLWELILFAMIGAFGGLVGSLFIKVNVAVAQLRGKYVNPRKITRIIDIIAIVSIWTTIIFLLPKIVPCSIILPLPSDGSVTLPEVLDQWDCPEGEFNSLASFLFNSQSVIFRLLLSQGPYYSFDYYSLIIFTVVYATGACLTAGATMAAGLMVPMLVIGAGYGRIFGKIVKYYAPGVSAGSYALIGATSFFGGVSRMTISLTIIMIEITNDLHFILPIMLTAMMAKWVGDYFTHPLYDLLIGAQRIPFLESECSPAFNILNAHDVMSRNIVVLPAFPKISDIFDTLSSNTHNGIPVVSNLDKGTYVGLILRSQLIVLLRGRAWEKEYSITFEELDTSITSLKASSLSDLVLSSEDMNQYLDLRPYMNSSQFTAQTTFAFDVVFRLFRSMGLRHLPVVNTGNRVVGIITRKDLLDPIVEIKYNQLISKRDFDLNKDLLYKAELDRKRNTLNTTEHYSELDAIN